MNLQSPPARLTLAAVAFLVVASARVVIDGAQAPPPAGNVPSGATAFTKVGCEACHGTQGRGTAAGRSLAASVLPIKDFIAYVRKPSGTMPPQSPQVVPDAALIDIHAFVHQSQPGQAPAAPPAAAPPGRVEAGAKLYGTVGCYQCHSNEGQGGVQGPRIGPNPVPFARFSSYLRNPTGDMPPYTAAVLSNQDLADIYAFLAARPQPPALNSIPQLAP